MESRLLGVRSGLDGPSPTPSANRREEAKRVAAIERDRLAEVTRVAVFEAIYRFPSPAPNHLFGWLRETVAHFTLDFLKEELAELETSSLRYREAEAGTRRRRRLSQVALRRALVVRAGWGVPQLPRGSLGLPDGRRPPPPETA